MNTILFRILLVVALLLSLLSKAQEIKVNVVIDQKYQIIEGFGAALAYYENWLTVHPNKAEIYEAIFNELSLDILRVRNAHEYDAGMVGRVKEFITASEGTQGRPIPFLATSWGPPARLKSNNDRKNGGTLKFTVANGKVEFNYAGFADWWNATLDEYQANGIYPTYISIQNEPDYMATYESCILNPFEKVNTSDTLAGYKQALKAVHDKVSTRTNVPRFLGSENIGIGYNSVKNYLLHADTTLLYGVAHHLYHGVDKENPWVNTEMKNLRNLYPKLKFFQTEYSGSDWFNLSGLIYKSLVDEQVSAYFYWDLIWDNGGLVSLENPWSTGSWKNLKGYEKRKEFYVFKQFSAFIHPGWQRVEVALASSEVNAVGFMSPTNDSLTVVVINRSTTNEKAIRFDIADFDYYQSEEYVTSSNFNCKFEGDLKEQVAVIPPHSVTTAFFTKTFKTGNDQILNVHQSATSIYPNPFNNFIHIKGKPSNDVWKLCSLDGRVILTGNSSKIDGTGLKNGVYLLKLNQQIIKVMKQ